MNRFLSLRRSLTSKQMTVMAAAHLGLIRCSLSHEPRKRDEGALCCCKVRAVRRLLLVGLVAVVPACSVVKASSLRPDWPQEDQRTVKRLAVIVEPLPEGNAKGAEMIGRVVRRYVNLKRDFLVKREVFSDKTIALAEVCGGDDAIEGVLVLHVTMTKKGEGYEAELTGSLQRCSDGREAWSVSAAGSFASKDERLTELTQVYVREIGPEVEPMVAPVMNLMRPALDTLPQPLLTEDDVNEKLSLD